jgi:hypothetical protein
MADQEKEKIILGEEKFESSKALDGEKKAEVVENSQNEVVEVDKVLVDDGGGKGKPRFSKMKFTLGALAVLAVFALLADTIRTAVFRAEDSLVFLGKGGFLTPAVGTILMAAGAVLAVIAFISLFNRRGKLQVGQKWLAVLAGVLLAVVGFSAFFRFTDFREFTIVDRTLLTTRAYTYLDVAQVDASTTLEGEDHRLNYTFTLQNGKRFEIRVGEKNMAAVKTIDTKIKSTAKRSIDNYALQEMARLKMYTEEEALKLFILE